MTQFWWPRCWQVIPVPGLKPALPLGNSFMKPGRAQEDAMRRRPRQVDRWECFIAGRWGIRKRSKNEGYGERLCRGEGDEKLWSLVWESVGWGEADEVLAAN